MRFRLLSETGRQSAFIELCQQLADGRIAVQDLPVAIRAQLQYSRTIAEHLRTLDTVTQYTLDEPRRRAFLNDLICAGLLVSDRAFVDLLSKLSVDPAAQTRVSGLAILTCDDPDSLARCITDVLRQASCTSCSYEVIVIDDSRQGEAVEENRKRLRRLAESFPLCSFRHADRSRRRTYSHIVSKESGVDSSLVLDLLTGRSGEHRTIGASRNCVLLQTVGTTVICLDDDMLSRAAEPCSEELVVLLSRMGPDELFQIFPSKPEYARSCVYHGINLFALNEQFLGLHPAQALSWKGVHVNVSRVDSSFAEELISSRSKLSLTVFGSGGRSGIGDPTRLLGVESCANFSDESEIDFDDIMRDQLSLRCPRALTVSKTANMHGAVFGLDNRTLLPPFISFGPGEDALFGATLGLCCPGAFSCSIPLAIQHDPPPYRTNHNVQLHTRLGHLGFTELMYFLITGITMPSALTARERFKQLGVYLRDLSTTKYTELKAIFMQISRRQTYFRREQLSLMYSSGRKTLPRWRIETARALSHMDSLLAASTSWMPADFLNLREPVKIEEATRAAVHSLALELTSWPDVWDAAVALRERREWLALPL